MENRLIEDWIAALESGEYLRGQSVLRRGRRFDPVGVLCEILHRRGQMLRSKVRNSPGLYSYGKGRETATPPSELIYDLNFERDILNYVIRLNDKGCTFKLAAEELRKVYGL